MGGPAVGEPSWKNDELSAVVRAAPFPTPCLELTSSSPEFMRWLSFEFDGSISSGWFVVIMDVWFDHVGDGETYFFSLYGNGWNNYFEVFVNSAGDMGWSGTGGHGGPLGAAQSGRPVPVMIALDLDAGTVSLWLDGAQVLQDQPDVIPAGTEMGRFECAVDASMAPDSRMWIDQIRILDRLPPVPVETMTWGRIRALYRD